MQTAMVSLIVTGISMITIASHLVVCDVDPSDTASILLEQLKVQDRQLQLDLQLVELQNKQLALQEEQLRILTQLNERPVEQPLYVAVLVSVSCSALGYLALVLVKRLLSYLQVRYNLSPEMPQTPQLMGFAHSTYQLDELERLRSAQRMKPPTDYFSCESDD